MYPTASYRGVNRHQTRDRRVSFRKVKLGLIVAMLLLAIGFFSMSTHASGDASAIKSGISGYCLDDHNSKIMPNNMVDAWGCNNTTAQSWSVTGTTITHNGNFCLAVKGNSKSINAPVVLNTCNDSPGQVWLGDKSGFINPNSGLCLSVPGGQTGAQLVTASCDQLGRTYETWLPSPTSNSNSCSGTRGQKIACFAAKEWKAWQAPGSNHEALLGQYTDGSPYEEWCADFVSYVYKEAGYHFTAGNSNGWDQNNANYIQYMGFTMHDPQTYTPEPGDVAYFDYNGGHVEIVISGGKNPTFVYGDSGTTDPTTGNGQMAANTITNDGSEGQLIYYLSPN